jgi:hypothetical protein
MDTIDAPALQEGYPLGLARSIAVLYSSSLSCEFRSASAAEKSKPAIVLASSRLTAPSSF